MPESWTVSPSDGWPSTSAARQTCTPTSPDSVNFKALPSRLISTWRSLPASSMARAGTSPSTSQVSSRCFWWAPRAIVRVTSSTNGSTAVSTGSTCIMPASIFEKSRMSLMTVSSTSAEVLTVSRHSRWCGVTGSSSSSSVMPTTPLSGVRSSWLMLARNSLFARLAASARSLASRSSAVRASTSCSSPARCPSSCRSRSSISCSMPLSPVISAPISSVRASVGIRTE